MTTSAGAARSSSSVARPPWGVPVVMPASEARSQPVRLLPRAGARWATYQASTNWAGYVATGQSFTAVSGTWVVPTVQPSSASAASGTWIGIDGFNNGSVIQTGTAQNSGNGRTSYSAWYELYPSPPVTIGSVAPGDVMKASITQSSPGTWTISITDLTSGQSASGSGPYNGPGTSAEWIEEAPFSARTGTTATLANFGTAQFRAIGVGGATPAADSLTGLAIADSSGNIIAYPSDYDASQGAFTVTYGSPRNASTTPPSSGQTTTAAVPASCAGAANRAVAGQVTAMAAMKSASGCEGYWLVTEQGRVTNFGAAAAYGDLAADSHAPVIAIAATADGLGYWLVTADGAVHGYGDAGFFGDMSGRRLNRPIIAMAATPDGHGYWLVGSDGGIFTFGNAAFFGSTGSARLNKPVVGIAPSPAGQGYWLVASDGGIFAFGAAPFLGSMGATPLNKPVVGVTADPAGRGYRMVATDGGIFSFGAPFFGSLGATPPAAGVRAMAPSATGNGYYMLGGDAAVYSFGDATFLGRGS